jgi:hypothetical protein
MFSYPAELNPPCATSFDCFLNVPNKHKRISAVDLDYIFHSPKSHKELCSGADSCIFYSPIADRDTLLLQLLMHK